MKIRVDKNFVSAFDEKSGKYMRTGILRGKKDTGVDPFMASFPELLDVGIMGHCIHGRTGLCVKAGIECYQDGLHRMEPNMSLEDFKSIVDQCRGRTFQIALGGCGTRTSTSISRRYCVSAVRRVLSLILRPPGSA